MNEEHNINDIIIAFRTILNEIFESSEEKMEDLICKPDFKNYVYDKIENYFIHLEYKDEISHQDLEIMKDGVLYLMEKIQNANSTLKALLYSTLFHDDEILTETELNHFIDKFSVMAL